jgi:sulfotransferase family protein
VTAKAEPLMTAPVIRIAMWSGPRNISTAMMRAFENRDDTIVVDEPFYAAALAATGADHPMRDEVIASQPTDPAAVVEGLLAPLPDDRRIHYQKHMTHHMQPGFPLDWTSELVNGFLIRAPEAVLRSYTQKWSEVSLEAIGVPMQATLFERECDRLGRAPPVIDAADVLADPEGTLSALCEACGIPFSERMLSWPPGRRETDGVWAPAWYDQVERSTGFGAPASQNDPAPLPDELKRIAAAARPAYERLRTFALRG